MFIRYQYVRNALITAGLLAAITLIAWHIFSGGSAAEEENTTHQAKATTTQGPGSAAEPEGGEAAQPAAEQDKPAAEQATPAAEQDKPAAPHQAAHHQLVDYFLKHKASGKKQKDLYKGEGAKVNLFDDDQDGSWDRLKLDLQRDGEWDEKWQLKHGLVERKLLKSGQVFIFKGNQWVPKK